MNVLRLRWRGLILAVVVCLTYQLFLLASDEPTLTKDQIKQFLLTAKVIKSVQSKKGITNPWRLTLTDGTLTHDGSFQSVEEHKQSVEFASGTELNFVDSYKYNIAAYQLAEMLGIDDMLPVYVERKWKGETGSLSWWLPVKMDEVERHRQNLTPPDADAWNNQMYKIRVFDQLVSDTDTNLTNVLIGEDWKIWRVDFSRAFRLQGKVKSPEDLVTHRRDQYHLIIQRQVSQARRSRRVAADCRYSPPTAVAHTSSRNSRSVSRKRAAAAGMQISINRCTGL